MAWDWQVFCRETASGDQIAGCFGKGGDVTYLDWILSTWGWTMSVAMLALAVARVIGSIAGILRTTPDRRLVTFGSAWTELFRNIPLRVQIFLWYPVLPALIPVRQGVPSFVLVVFALGFFTSARISEQVRAGIQSLPRGQRHAGLAMGLTLPQSCRYVLLAMSFRIVIPPLTSESMNIVENSSAAFADSISELTRFALQAGEETSRNVEMYLALIALYFVSAFAIDRVMLFDEGRVRAKG
ncbi:MAG: amino acid ABC transporter permease [Burkholderiales bacterium]|nr:amino acid ABC transporter permease [Burkholderiales bacterium]